MIRDGDTYRIGRLHAEVLDTNGRLGIRLTSIHGYGVCLEDEEMQALNELLAKVDAHRRKG